MAIESLRELYLEELKDTYNAEQQILKALPKMEEAASHNELKQAFRQHRQQTEEQSRRLERIFDSLDEKPTGKKCKGIEGIIDEGDEMMKDAKDNDTRDAALIAAAQRVEHYEIAAYGTLRTYARQLGRDQDATLLQETLNEEGETDKRLTRLAESTINREAAARR